MKQRLQKLISAAGLTSRRKSEELIKMGKVTVNGIPAALGDSADPDTDIICVDGKLLAKCEERTYIMLYKPRGYVTTLKDEKKTPLRKRACQRPWRASLSGRKA